MASEGNNVQYGDRRKLNYIWRKNEIVLDMASDDNNQMWLQKKTKLGMMSERNKVRFGVRKK